MSQNPKKPKSTDPKVGPGFSLWGNQTASRQNHLLEFKAGKMYVRENMVYPDKRNGQVYLFQDVDGAMHFCWMDRIHGTVEDDLITMPADASFKRVEKCTTGRVYILKIKSSSTVRFFWMQEPSAANDLDICNRVNSLLNFPPPRTRMLFPEIALNEELQTILNQLNSAQLGAIYNGNEIIWVDSTNESVEIDEFSTPPTNSTTVPDPFVNLAGVIDEESIKVITENPALMNRIESKLPFTQESPKENIKSTIKSAPFQNAIEDFSVALKMGVSGPLLKDLNVNGPAIAAAENGDVDSFIKALQGEAASTIINQSRGGSSHGPGSSGSPQGNMTAGRDQSSRSGNKNGEMGKKEESNLEGANYQPAREQSGRKRTHELISLESNSEKSVAESEIKKMKISDSPLESNLDEQTRQIDKSLDPQITGRENVNAQLPRTNFERLKQPKKRFRETTTSKENISGSEAKKMKNVDSTGLKLDNKIATNTNVMPTQVDRHRDHHKVQKSVKFQATEEELNRVVKVEDEQQTEPVTVRSTTHTTGPETKISTKKVALKETSQRDGNASVEKYQNTDPVRVEEKQKRQSKFGDPKQPDESSKDHK